MAATCKFLGLIIVWACFALAARAQYLAIGGGGVFSEDLRSSGSGTFGQDQANFSKSGMLAVDAGIGFLPFITGGFHYSYARPELELRRGDAFGSSARVDLTAHTLTFDARLRTPHYADFRLYGLLGAGFSRFSLAVRQAVEVPFPGGAPDKVLSPVFTYGGGIEKSFAPLVHLKLEVRDYLTAVSEDLYRPGGVWHRVAVTAGIVLGR